MRTKIKIASIFALILGFTACNVDDNNVVVQPGEKAVIVSPEEGSSVTLDPANVNNPALTVVWNHAKYSVGTEVSYMVEVAKGGTEFAMPVPAGTTTQRQITWSVADLNGVCQLAGLTPFEAGDLDIRIKASIGAGGVLESISDKITVSVTPFSTDLPKLYMIGDFLSAGGYGANWTIAPTLPFIAASAYGKTDFEGYIYFNAANFEYKFLPVNTSYDGDYEDDGSFSGTLTQSGSSNCLGTGAGYYLVKANTGVTSPTNPGGLQYSIQQTRWAITGGATPLGWPDGGVVDQDMTYNSTTKKWEITIALTAGGNQFKFRANDGWDLNLGADGPDKDSSMDYSGENLSVATAGTYKVELDLSSPRDFKWSATLQ